MIADDDPLARRLFEAVWSDPSSDAPRMVLMDYLLEHGDPMGELIAVQLERARTGAAISERELELVVVHGRRMLGPLALYVGDLQFERGFLVAASVAPGPLPEDAVTNPRWSTVERLKLHTESPVLESGYLTSLRTLHVTPDVARVLSRRTAALPIRALTAANAHDGLGMGTEGDVFDLLDHLGAFDHVRALSLDAWRLEQLLNVRPVLDSKLIRQLEHLNLTFASVRLDDIRLWRRWFESSPLARFGVQLPLGSYEIEMATTYYGSTNFMYAEIERGTDAAIVQLEDPTEPALVVNAVAAIAELGRSRVIVEDLRDSPRLAERQGALLDALRGRFAEVIAHTGAVRAREP